MAESEKQMLVSEVNLLRELKHPNIVRYYDRIIDRTNTTLYIVMEHCEGGDLSSLISRCIKERWRGMWLLAKIHTDEVSTSLLPVSFHRIKLFVCFYHARRYLEEKFVLGVMAQLTLALKECHRRSDGRATVLHRDLKPANIFLDIRHNVKLGDFGLARILNHDTSFAKTFVGTPYYMSPVSGWGFFSSVFFIIMEQLDHWTWLIPNLSLGTNKPVVLQREVRYLVTRMFAVWTLCIIVSFWSFLPELISPSVDLIATITCSPIFHLAPRLLHTTKKSWQRRSERGSTEESLTDTLRSWITCSAKCST